MIRVGWGVWLGTLLIFLYCISANIADPDMWHQMALIREAIRIGHLPVKDPFAYAPTLAPVMHHEWGAGAIAYAIAVTLGGAGIMFWKYLLGLAIAGLCVGLALRRGARPAVIVLLAPIAVLLVDYGFGPVRAQVYSFLFAAIALHLLERDQEGDRRWIGGWLLMFTLWVNLHGGFPIGLLLLAAHTVERFVRRKPCRPVLFALLASVALAGVNPYGGRYYTYILHAVTMPRPDIAEWDPLIGGRLVPGYEVAAFLVSIMLAGYSLFRIGAGRALGISLLVITSLLAVKHNRMLPFYGIAWMSLVPGWVEGTPLAAEIGAVFTRRARTIAFIYGVITPVFAVEVMALQPWRLKVPGSVSHGNGGCGIRYPVGAANYMKEAGFRGNLMTPFDYGAFISYKLYPQVRVSLDSRYEAAYSDAWVEENARFYRGAAGWERTLARYPTDLVLAPRGCGLTSRLKAWPSVYEDPSFILYERPGLRLPRRRTERAIDGAFP